MIFIRYLIKSLPIKSNDAHVYAKSLYQESTTTLENLITPDTSGQFRLNSWKVCEMRLGTDETVDYLTIVASYNWHAIGTRNAESIELGREFVSNTL